MEKSHFLLSKCRYEINKLHHFSFCINCAYAIFDNQLVAWIPDSENLYFDNLEFLDKNPVQFDNFGTKKIVKIICNNQVMHSIADDGNVYSWGNDRDKTGILGLGFAYNQSTPLLNTNFSNKKIIDISLSEKHAAALDSNRQIFTWGTGNHGELGKEGTTFSNVPIALQLGKSSFAIKVQCGPTYTAFIDFNYKVIYCGKIMDVSQNKTVYDSIYNKSFCSRIPQENMSFITEDNNTSNIEFLSSTSRALSIDNVSFQDIFCGTSLLAIVDKEGGLYFYNDEENLYKVKIEHKIQSVKFINSNLYALTRDRNFLYEFISKGVKFSMNNYLESLFEVNQKISTRLSMIDLPYFTNLLFFMVECPAQTKAEVERGSRKILTPFKYNTKTNISNDERMFFSDEENNTSRLTSLYTGSKEASRCFTNKSRAETQSESKVRPSVYPPNKSVGRREKSFRDQYRDVDKSKTSNVNESRMGKISNLLSQIFDKKINQINSQLSFADAHSQQIYSNGKRRVQLERVGKNSLTNRILNTNTSFTNNKKNSACNSPKDSYIHNYNDESHDLDCDVDLIIREVKDEDQAIVKEYVEKDSNKKTSPVKVLKIPTYIEDNKKFLDISKRLNFNEADDQKELILLNLNSNDKFEEIEYQFSLRSEKKNAFENIKLKICRQNDLSDLSNISNSASDIRRKSFEVLSTNQKINQINLSIISNSNKLNSILETSFSILPANANENSNNPSESMLNIRKNNDNICNVSNGRPNLTFIDESKILSNHLVSNFNEVNVVSQFTLKANKNILIEETFKEYNLERNESPQVFKMSYRNKHQALNNSSRKTEERYESIDEKEDSLPKEKPREEKDTPKNNQNSLILNGSTSDLRKDKTSLPQNPIIYKKTKIIDNLKSKTSSIKKIENRLSPILQRDLSEKINDSSRFDFEEDDPIKVPVSTMANEINKIPEKTLNKDIFNGSIITNESLTDSKVLPKQNNSFRENKYSVTPEICPKGNPLLTNIFNKKVINQTGNLSNIFNLPNQKDNKPLKIINAATISSSDENNMRTPSKTPPIEAEESLTINNNGFVYSKTNQLNANPVEISSIQNNGSINLIKRRNSFKKQDKNSNYNTNGITQNMNEPASSSDLNKDIIVIVKENKEIVKASDTTLTENTDLATEKDPIVNSPRENPIEILIVKENDELIEQNIETPHFTSNKRANEFLNIEVDAGNADDNTNTCINIIIKTESPLNESQPTLKLNPENKNIVEEVKEQKIEPYNNPDKIEIKQEEIINTEMKEEVLGLNYCTLGIESSEDMQSVKITTENVEENIPSAEIFFIENNTNVIELLKSKENNNFSIISENEEIKFVERSSSSMEIETPNNEKENNVDSQDKPDQFAVFKEEKEESSSIDSDNPQEKIDNNKIEMEEEKRINIKEEHIDDNSQHIYLLKKKENCTPEKNIVDLIDKKEESKAVPVEENEKIFSNSNNEENKLNKKEDSINNVIEIKKEENFKNKETENLVLTNDQFREQKFVPKPEKITIITKKNMSSNNKPEIIPFEKPAYANNTDNIIKEDLKIIKNKITEPNNEKEKETKLPKPEEMKISLPSNQVNPFTKPVETPIEIKDKFNQVDDSLELNRFKRTKTSSSKQLEDKSSLNLAKPKLNPTEKTESIINKIQEKIDRVLNKNTDKKEESSIINPSTNKETKPMAITIKEIQPVKAKDTDIVHDLGNSFKQNQNSDYERSLKEFANSLKPKESSFHKRTLSLESNLKKQIAARNNKIDNILIEETEQFIKPANRGSLKTVEADLNKNDKNKNANKQKDSVNNEVTIQVKSPTRLNEKTITIPIRSLEEKDFLFKSPHKIVLSESIEVISNKETVNVGNPEDLNPPTNFVDNTSRVVIQEDEVPLEEEEEDIIYYYITEVDNLTEIAEVDELNESEQNSLRHAGSNKKQSLKKGLIRNIKAKNKKDIINLINSNSNNPDSGRQKKPLIPKNIKKNNKEAEESNESISNSKKHLVSNIIKAIKSSGLESNDNLTGNNALNEFDSPAMNKDKKYHLLSANLKSKNNFPNANEPEASEEVDQQMNPNTRNIRMKNNLDNIIEEEEDTMTNPSNTISPQVNNQEEQKFRLNLTDVEDFDIKDKKEEKEESHSRSQSQKLVNERAANKERIKSLNERLQNLKRTKSMNMETNKRILSYTESELKGLLEIKKEQYNITPLMIKDEEEEEETNLLKMGKNVNESYNKEMKKEEFLIFNQNSPPQNLTFEESELAKIENNSDVENREHPPIKISNKNVNKNLILIEENLDFSSCRKPNPYSLINSFENFPTFEDYNPIDTNVSERMKTSSFTKAGKVLFSRTKKESKSITNNSPIIKNLYKNDSFSPGKATDRKINKAPSSFNTTKSNYKPISKNPTGDTKNKMNKIISITKMKLQKQDNCVTSNKPINTETDYPHIMQTNPTEHSMAKSLTHKIFQKRNNPPSENTANRSLKIIKTVKNEQKTKALKETVISDSEGYTQTLASVKTNSKNNASFNNFRKKTNSKSSILSLVKNKDSKKNIPAVFEKEKETPLLNRLNKEKANSKTASNSISNGFYTEEIDSANFEAKFLSTDGNLHDRKLPKKNDLRANKSLSPLKKNSKDVVTKRRKSLVNNINYLTLTEADKPSTTNILKSKEKQGYKTPVKPNSSKFINKKRGNLRDENELKKEIYSTIENLKDAVKTYMSSDRTAEAKESLKELIKRNLVLFEIKSEVRGTLIVPDSKSSPIRLPESMNSSFSLDDDTSLINEESFQDNPEGMRNYIIKNLENFKLGSVKEKLESYLSKVGNLSPQANFCLTPPRLDHDSEDRADKYFELEPLELDRSHLTMKSSISQSHRRSGMQNPNNADNLSGSFSSSVRKNSCQENPSSSSSITPFKVWIENELSRSSKTIIKIPNLLIPKENQSKLNQIEEIDMEEMYSPKKRENNNISDRYLIKEQAFRFDLTDLVRENEKK